MLDTDSRRDIFFFPQHSLRTINVNLFEQKSDIWGVIRGLKHRHEYNVGAWDIDKEMADMTQRLWETHPLLGHQVKGRLNTLWFLKCSYIPKFKHLSPSPNSSVDLGFTLWCHCSVGCSLVKSIHTNDYVCKSCACKFHFLVISSNNKLLRCYESYEPFLFCLTILILLPKENPSPELIKEKERLW